MSEWVSNKIGDFCIVGDGAHGSLKRFTSGVMYLTSKNFKDGGLDLSKVDYISPETYEKYFRKTSKALTKPNTDDVLFSIIGTIGEPYLVQPNDCFGISSSVAIIRPIQSKVYPRYLFYWIKGDTFQSALYGIKGGVAQGYVSLEMIRSLPLYLPSLPTQRRIAAILSAYDDLIENNTRRIKLLEQAAHDLYREWFVEFRFPGHESVPLVDSGTNYGMIPQGWKIVSVSNAIEINPRIAVDKGKEKPFIEMARLSESSMFIDTKKIQFRTGNSGAKFQNYDTLFARITPCLENGKTGYVTFLANEGVALGSTEFVVMRSRTLTPEYVYCLSRLPDFRASAEKTMTGASGRQRVQNSFFDNYLIVQPTQHILVEFQEMVSAMFDEISVLADKNDVLCEARDLLLPRLVSGQVDVSDLDIPAMEMNYEGN